MALPVACRGARWASAAASRSGRVGSATRPRTVRDHPLVEVGGIEPPSRETSAPASPSAADSERSGPEASVGESPRTLSGVDLDPPVPEPRRGQPALRCPVPAGQAPSGRTRCSVRQRVRQVRRHLLVVPGSLTRTPGTSARFRRLDPHGRNHVTPMGDTRGVRAHGTAPETCGAHRDAQRRRRRARSISRFCSRSTIARRLS